MTGLVVGVSAGVGLVAGWFVPLPAYRLAVAAGDPPRAACRLGHPLPQWRWHCPQCRIRCGPPAWLTALVTAAVCALLAAVIGARLVLPLYLAAGILGVLLACIDIACKRLPHALVVPATGVAAVGLTIVAAITGQWSHLFVAFGGAAALGAVFLLLFLIPGGGLGFGDVKLAVLLGLFLGWIGWRVVLLGGLLPWLLNGPVLLVLLVSGRVGRRSSVPFGPAMLTGALVAIGVSGWWDVIGRP